MLCVLACRNRREVTILDPASGDCRNSISPRKYVSVLFIRAGVCTLTPARIFRGQLFFFFEVPFIYRIFTFELARNDSSLVHDPGPCGIL
jgi:hypothetical protein